VSFVISEIVVNRIRKEIEMANIGATTAFYKVETSLTRANNEVSKSMERLATGKQNANAGDRSSYAAMADTFRLDYVGTKAGIKGASVVMGYLETGMRVLDSASGLLARLQELAVLGANDTNTINDHEAINQEAEAIAQEFNRLMLNNTYKGKNIFVDTADSEFVSLGGRDAEMTFGVGKFDYSELYGTARTVEAGLPNAGQLVNLTFLPSDAVVGPIADHATKGANAVLKAGKSYVITTAPTLEADRTNHDALKAASTLTNDGQVNDVFTMTKDFTLGGDIVVREALLAGRTYEITTVPSDPNDINALVTKSNLTSTDQVVVGMTFTMDSNHYFATGETAATREINANEITNRVESVQKKINTARVQAGSQYAALESAIIYTTDLTAQYELGYNTVHDVNFSMETAHLAKNQILQQAATAMLAQANQGQQGLLQLIQG
jgi:flagellin